MFLNKIYKLVLDVLFPIECLGCGKEDVWVCEKCLDKIEINNKGLQQPDVSPSVLDGFFVASSRENKILQQMIEKLKYNFSQELAGSLASILIKKLELILKDNLIQADLIIIPIPLHKKRYNWRGFNQSELLTKRICHELDLKFDNQLIKRIKNTKSQVKQIDKQARQKNIENAFKMKKSAKISVKNVLLIDDVITTGATMNECAKVLKKFGAEKVFGLVLSRG